MCFCARGLCGKILTLQWNKWKPSEIVMTSHLIFMNPSYLTQLTFLWHLIYCQFILGKVLDSYLNPQTAQSDQFHHFSQSFMTNARIYHKLQNHRLIHNNFQFIIQPSSYHSMLHNPTYSKYCYIKQSIKNVTHRIPLGCHVI